MTYCGSQTLVKHVGAERRALSLRCRSWLCPDCADSRKRILIAQCHGGAPNTFLTLTWRVRPNVTPNEAAKQLSRSWRLLRLRIMRQRGMRKLPFQTVIEATAAGWPHLHILLRSIWIDKYWLSAQMQELCGSPIVKIQRIDRKAQVAAYVAKYAGSCAHKFGTAKRYWRSRDYDLRPKTENMFTWRADPFVYLVPTQLQKWVDLYVHQGWTVERPSAWQAHARPPPERKIGRP